MSDPIVPPFSGTMDMESGTIRSRVPAFAAANAG